MNLMKTYMKKRAELAANKLNKNKKGFTTIELVIVIAIISVLATVLIPQMSSMVDKAKISGVQQNFREMQIAAQTVAYEHAGFNSIDGLLDAGGSTIADATKLYDALNVNFDPVNKIADDGTMTRKDPWGNVYDFNYDKDTNGVTFTSGGPDGVIGDADATEGGDIPGGGTYDADTAAAAVAAAEDDLSTTVKFENGSVRVLTAGFSLNAQ